ncbi:hypothetical protein D3C77_329830 [compost metagenome]
MKIGVRRAAKEQHLFQDSYLDALWYINHFIPINAGVLYNLGANFAESSRPECFCKYESCEGRIAKL